MPLKKIIPIVITVAAVVIFGVVLGVNYFKSSLPNGIVEVGAPTTLASGAVGIGPYFEPSQALQQKHSFQSPDHG